MRVAGGFEQRTDLIGTKVESCCAKNRLWEKQGQNRDSEWPTATIQVGGGGNASGLLWKGPKKWWEPGYLEGKAYRVSPRLNTSCERKEDLMVFDLSKWEMELPFIKKGEMTGRTDLGVDIRNAHARFEMPAGQTPSGHGRTDVGISLMARERQRLEKATLTSLLE